jgi:hypothetical protein
MKKLRIGFSKPKDKLFPLFSWAIRLYEGTPYSHVYIRWETKWNTWLCYHAASLMIHFLGEASFARHITVVEEFEFEVDEEKFDKLMAFCTKYVGEDYALMEVVMIPFWDALSKQGKTFPSLANGANKQYCAELVMRALGEMNGKELTQDADRVKLKYVYEFVKEKHRAGATI